MSKNITAGISALEHVSLSNVKRGIESGKMVPTAFSELTAPEKLYVKLLSFERRSPEEACRIIAKKLNAAGSPVEFVPEELLAQYMYSPKIKASMLEIVRIRDDEFSLQIQQSGRVAESILSNLMLNSQDEEIKLKAASKVVDIAAKDYADKRAKTKIEINQHNTSNVIEWQIHTYDKKSEEALKEQQVIDATVVEISDDDGNNDAETIFGGKKKTA